jgi:hypothetical protein
MEKESVALKPLSLRQRPLMEKDGHSKKNKRKQQDFIWIDSDTVVGASDSHKGPVKSKRHPCYGG